MSDPPIALSCVPRSRAVETPPCGGVPTIWARVQRIGVKLNNKSRLQTHLNTNHGDNRRMSLYVPTPSVSRIRTRPPTRGPKPSFQEYPPPAKVVLRASHMVVLVSLPQI